MKSIAVTMLFAALCFTGVAETVGGSQARIPTPSTENDLDSGAKALAAALSELRVLSNEPPQTIPPQTLPPRPVPLPLFRTPPSNRDDFFQDLRNNPLAPTLTPLPEPGRAFAPAEAIIKGGILTLDLSKGLYRGEPPRKSANLQRLQNVVFTINSLNDRSPDLLRVEDLIKGRTVGGVIPDRVDIDIERYLGRARTNQVSDMLGRSRFLCDSAKRERNISVSADDFVSAAFDTENYERLMVPNTSEEQERLLGISDELRNGIRENTTREADRFIVKAGTSGILFEAAERKITFETTNDGRVIARSSDPKRSRANDDNRVFSHNPHGAVGDGSEAIRVLPNGMMYYDARDSKGKRLGGPVPSDIVTRHIEAPVTCMRCHAGGFIGADEVVPPGSIRDTSENKDSQKLFGTTEDYTKVVNRWNEVFQKSMNTSGVGSGKEISRFQDNLTNGSYQTEDLAKELHISTTRLNEVLRTPRIQRVLERFRISPETQGLTRDQLSKPVSTGGRSTSLYCAIKESLVDLDARSTPRRGREPDFLRGGTHDDERL